MSHRHGCVRAILLSLLALSCSAAPTGAAIAAPARRLSADALRFVGDWDGALPVGGARVQIIFRIIHGELGGLVGTIDIPEQHASGIGMDSLLISRGAIRVALGRIGASYHGVMAENGGIIRGTWTQGGYSMPLDLGRGAAPEPRRSQDPVPPYPYAVEDVSIENRAAGVRLAGTITRPRGAGPFPAVLMITGSGPQNRDDEMLGHRPFLVIADRLTRAGLEVLRCDDRGTGKSTGAYATSTTADFASDARAELEFLRSRPEVARARVGLLGHSEGGVIAPLLASQDRSIAFLVLLSAPGVPGDSLLLLQNEALERASGRRDDMSEWNRALQRRLFAAVRAARDTNGLDASLHRVVRRAIGSLSAAQRGRIPPGFEERQVASVSSPWLRWFLAHDPRPALRRITCPVLALAGARDLQVTPKENLSAIAGALRAGGDRDARTIELPGLDHLLQTSATGLPSEYGSIEETIAPVALDTITNWIRAHVAPAR